VGAWLLCQAAGLASAPLALWRAPAEAGIVDECCPGVAPGQVCPMHHAKEGGRTCVMRNACSQSNAALLVLSGGIGVPPRATAAVAVAIDVESVSLTESTTFARTSRPESPPPRA
jgi:hypothetical protein